MCVWFIHLTTHRRASFISKCSAESFAFWHDGKQGRNISSLHSVGAPKGSLKLLVSATLVLTPLNHVPLGMWKAPASPSNGTKTFGYQRSTLQQVSRSVLLQYPGWSQVWLRVMFNTCSCVMSVSIQRVFPRHPLAMTWPCFQEPKPWGHHGAMPHGPLSLDLTGWPGPAWQLNSCARGFLE